MLSAQQQLVLDEKRMIFSMLDGARDTLDARGLGLVQASALLLALVGLVRLPAFVSGPVNDWQVAGPVNDWQVAGPVNDWQVAALAVAFLAFAGMVGLFLAAMTPVVYTLPGTLDWDELGERYLMAEEEDCYDQVLSNLILGIERMMAVNGRKGLCLRWAMVLFIVQVVGLLGLALLP